MTSDKEKEYEALEMLIAELMESTADPGEIHDCPVCGGKLHIHFDIYSRGNRKILGVQAWCEGCKLAIAIDSAELPVWLSQDDVSPSSKPAFNTFSGVGQRG